MVENPKEMLIDFANKHDIDCIIDVERHEDYIILKHADGSLTNIRGELTTKVIQDNLIKASIILRKSKVKPSFNME